MLSKLSISQGWYSWIMQQIYLKLFESFPKQLEISDRELIPPNWTFIFPLDISLLLVLSPPLERKNKKNHTLCKTAWILVKFCDLVKKLYCLCYEHDFSLLILTNERKSFKTMLIRYLLGKHIYNLTSEFVS